MKRVDGLLILSLIWFWGCASSRPSATVPAVSSTAPPPPAVVPEVLASGAAVLASDTVQAGRFDNGKMWTFEDPPIAYFAEAYGFRPDSNWFREARLGALRLPNCSASFVSPNGLVMTNHHCAREAIVAVSQPGENLLDHGFYARSLAEERRAEDYYVDQLIEIRDVTHEVYAALEGAETDAERAMARQQAIEALEQRLLEEKGGEEAGYVVEVISLYNGAKYSAYIFRRYRDLRLVMAPELQLGYFGGDPDNFTYPRYALDVTFFRVYDENGRPMRTPHYFRWSQEGVKEGDAVFVIGNPGSTSRLQTVAQLEFRRDVLEPAILRLIQTRMAALQEHLQGLPEGSEREQVRNEIFSLSNAEKLYTGRVKGLRDPYIIARRRDAERRFREALQRDSTLAQTYDPLFDRMAELVRQQRTYATELQAFLGFNPGSSLSSTVERRAILAFIYASRKQVGASEEMLAELRQQILSVEDQPKGVQWRYLKARLEDFVHYFGASSPVVQQILQGRDPEEVAQHIVAHSVLADSAQAAQALASGTLTLEDPAVALVAAVWPRFQAFQSAWAGISAQQQEIASQLGRARYEVYGTAVPPDATFSLRIADGVVKGYTYNGTLAPPYTTFYGLYDRYYAFGPATDWTLPERWLHPSETFDRSTPLNFVATADIIGGNSGSPVINAKLEVVGLVFDGNIESLPADYIYLPDRGMRAVAVDVRGILEALDEIYDADRLVLELTTGEVVGTEEEADARMSQKAP
ncbi:S46 family peptidase [Rhodothermus bifroesti]|nr:S46 family peptidase [Rhodothermus bifroesti]GBD00770.1 Asp/Glu-specific dipeptidyl-peptidase [bacterium HR18]